MASFKTEELIKGLNIAIKSAKEFLAISVKTNESIKATATSIAKFSQGLNLSSASGLKEFNTELAKTNALVKQKTENDKKTIALTKDITTLEKNQVKLSKEKLALDKQLKNATDEEVKAKLKLQAATKQQRDILKDTLILENQEAGTLQKIAAESRILRREREGLNLETEKGRKRLTEINATLDKNNARIDKNSDKLKKQKINVGNYTKSTTEAINASGLFSSQLMVLQRIQATLNAFTQKNTAETTANATAQKAAAASSTGFSKALRVLKFALISTGIGAIVVGLGSLIAAFAGTQRGVDAFTKVLRPLTTIFQKFIGFLEQTAFKALDELKKAFEDPKQAVIDLGNAIVDNLIRRFNGFVDAFSSGSKVIIAGFQIMAAKIKLSLKDVPIIGKAIDVEQTEKDLKEATESMSGNLDKLGDAAIQAATGVEGGIEKVNGVIDDLGDAISDAYSEGEELDRLIKRFERRQIELVIPLAEARLEFQKLKEVANDQLRTDQERVDALNEAMEVQKTIAASEGELLDLKIKRMELEQSFNDTSREEELELQKLRAEKIRFEEQAQKKISGLVSLRSGIELRAEKARQKALDESFKQVEELELRLKSDEFENEIVDRIKVYQSEVISIQNNIILSTENRQALLLKLEEEFQNDLLEIESKRIEESQKQKEEEIDKEVEAKQRELKEIELEGLKQGETELEIAEDISNKKIELLEEEIAKRKEIGQDTIDLELDLLKQRKEHNEKFNKQEEVDRKEVIDALANYAMKATDMIYEGKVRALDNELDQSVKNQEIIQRGIEAGSELGEQSLAREKKVQAEREAEIRRLEAQALKLNALIALLQVWGNTGNLGETLAGFATVKTAASDIDGNFYEGTDSVGSTGSETKVHNGRDGFNAMLDEGEMVFNSNQSKELRGLGFTTRDSMLDLARMADVGVNKKTPIVAVNQDNSILLSEIKEQNKLLKELPNKMPIHNTGLTDDPRYIQEVIKKANVTSKLQRRAKGTWAR